MTTPSLPATSIGNLSDHSPFSTLIIAFFLPKNTLERNENNIGPLKFSG